MQLFVVIVVWLHMSEKTTMNSVTIRCHFGVNVQVQKTNDKELQCSSLLWCGIACTQK
jgi:hypothetical protein